MIISLLDMVAAEEKKLEDQKRMRETVATARKE